MRTLLLVFALFLANAKCALRCLQGQHTVNDSETFELFEKYCEKETETRCYSHFDNETRRATYDCATNAFCSKGSCCLGDMCNLNATAGTFAEKSVENSLALQRCYRQTPTATAYRFDTVYCGSSLAPAYAQCGWAKMTCDDYRTTYSAKYVCTNYEEILDVALGCVDKNREENYKILTHLTKGTPLYAKFEWCSSELHEPCVPSFINKDSRIASAIPDEYLENASIENSAQNNDTNSNESSASAKHEQQHLAISVAIVVLMALI